MKKFVTTEKIVFWAFGLSGAAALIYEVVWTRAISLVLGSSTYALSTMLAAFMAGLSLGAYSGGRWADESPDPLFLFGLLELGISLFGVITLIVIRNLSPIYAWLFYTFHLSFSSFSFAQFGLAFLIMVIPTTLMGATFPIVLKIRAKIWEELGQESGNVYSINTVGAILGSLAAGFMLIPLLGVRGANITAASINFFIATVIFVISKSRLRLLLSGSSFLLLGLLIFFTATWPGFAFPFNYYMAERYPSYEMFLDDNWQWRLLFEREGVQGKVQVFRNLQNGTVFLVNGGKIEGSTGSDWANQLLLAYLPLSAYPKAETFLNIGLGTGSTLGAAAEKRSLKKIYSVEINPAVNEAVETYFYPELWEDERIEFVVADARNYLMLKKRKYDIISSEPSYPTDESVSHLFTEEFFKLVKARLSSKGVFTQWVPQYLFREKEMKALIKTFGKVFPHYYTWDVQGIDLIIVGSNSPLAKPKDIEKGVNFLFGEDKLISQYRLYRYQKKDLDKIDNLPMNTDDYPFIEFAAARNRIYGTSEVKNLQGQ